MMQKHSLDMEQMAWRRWAIQTKAGGDLSKFKQEYPLTDDEAFIVSGNPVFEPESVKEVGKHVRLPIWRGNLVASKVDPLRRPEMEANDKGTVKIWVSPEAHHHYVIGGDVAFGQKGTGDYSTAQVIDRNTWQVVAEWHGHIPPDLFGEQVKLLARTYNEAFVGVEVNGDGGLTVNRYLRDNYGSIYTRVVYDNTSDKEVDKLGWQTDKKTKPMMISDLSSSIRENEITIYNSELINELLTFVHKDDGSMGAQESGYDDRVMALAIALQMCNFISEGRKPKGEPTVADMIASDIRAEEAKQIPHDEEEGEFEELL